MSSITMFVDSFDIFDDIHNPSCWNVGWFYFNDKDGSVVINPRLYNRRECKKWAYSKMWLSYNSVIWCFKDPFITEDWSLAFNESRYVLPFWSTEVKMPWGYDYTWNTILISWENLLGETINYDEDTMCAYKSTWIKVCRKNKHSEVREYYNKSWELCDVNNKLSEVKWYTNKSWELYDIHNIQFGNVIYQDLTCLLWYEKIINN